MARPTNRDEWRTKLRRSIEDELEGELPGFAALSDDDVIGHLIHSAPSSSRETERLELADRLMALAPPPGVGHPRFSDWYSSLARQIEREDGLVHQRLTWMMQFEGFLFAAVGVAAKVDGVRALSAALLISIPLVGVFVALITFLGVAAAHGALGDLKELYLRVPRRERFIRPFGGYQRHGLGRLSALLLPLLIVAAWVLSAFLFWCFTRHPGAVDHILGPPPASAQGVKIVPLGKPLMRT